MKRSTPLALWTLSLTAPLAFVCLFGPPHPPPVVHAQGSTVDCSSTFSFTAAALQSGRLNQSQGTPCVAFRVTYDSTGTLSASVQFETSPDNVTFTAVPNTICSSTVQPPCLSDGANPMPTAATGTQAVRAYGKYWRINVVSTTGTGTGTVRIYGYKGTSASAGTGGGGVGPAGPTGPTGPQGPQGIAADDKTGGTSGWSGQPLTFVSTTTQYAPFVGGGIPSATETAVSTKASGAQTISKLHVTIDAALGASATLAVTLEGGTATATALTCTTAGGGVGCDNVADSVSVADLTLLSWKLVSSGVVTAGIPQIKISYAVGTSGYNTRTCEIPVGDPGAGSPVLADDNDTPGICANDTINTMNITGIHCYAPAGSPSIRPIISGGSATSILSGDLTCTSTAGGAAGTLNGTPTEAPNATIDANIATAGGVAKYLVIRITRTL